MMMQTVELAWPALRKGAKKFAAGVGPMTEGFVRVSGENGK
jgi:hypothetical protein